jgi:hypothetical protein
MMGQLVEIVFEALSFKQLKNVCKDISQKEDVLEGNLNNFENNLEANCIDIPLGRLSFNSDVIIDNVHLRLLNYEKQKFDVEINFNLEDIINTSTMRIETVLFNYSLGIANRNGIDNYFAGIDPASDEVTRFFTGKKLGPYSLPK